LKLEYACADAATDAIAAGIATARQSTHTGGKIIGGVVEIGGGLIVDVIGVGTGLAEEIAEAFIVPVGPPVIGPPEPPATGFNRIDGTKDGESLDGTAGADLIKARGGDDEVHAGAGNDVVKAGGGHDTVHGDAGIDILKGNGGNDALHGGADSDILIGGGGRDHLDGGDALDVLKGGKGHDVLDGGEGPDHLFGGGGDDTFVFRSTGDSTLEAYDTIHGFQRAGRKGGDVIDVSMIDAVQAGPGQIVPAVMDQFEFGSQEQGGLWTVDYKGDTLVLGNTNGVGDPDLVIRIVDGDNVSAADYTAEDFNFGLFL
jgi:Ca2+-binding RTX toxin-like protein